MQHLSLNKKLWLALAVVWCGLVVMIAWGVVTARNTMLDEQRNTLKSMIQAANSIVATYEEFSTSYAMTPDDAKREALAQLRSIRYGKDGYIIVSDARPVVLMDPADASLEGKPAARIKDKRGTAVFSAIAKAGGQKGGGFVEYFWPKPSGGKPIEKLTYVRYFKPWGWYLSTGVYLDDVAAASRMALLRAAGLALAVGLAVTAVMLVIIRNVKRSLGGEPAYAAGAAERIADGDLRQPVETRSDDRRSMLYAMRRMQQNLVGIVTRIQTASAAITHAAGDISQGNAALATRTEEQAASLEETAASLEQLTASVRQNAEHATQASQFSAGASATASRGGKVVGDVVDTINEIAGSSKKIGEITGLIESIAFQTNILALNAAVEAARAGEHGRGFAVVAGEVRALAQRSAAAAKDIKELIAQASGKVDAGTRLAAQAGGTMQEIVTAVQRVSGLMDEIAAATVEQSHGIEQVNQAVMQIDMTTRQNANLVEDTRAAAQALEAQAGQLHAAVALFRIDQDAASPVASDTAQALDQASASAPSDAPFVAPPAQATRPLRLAVARRA